LRRSLLLTVLLTCLSIPKPALAACDMSGLAAGTEVAELQTAVGSICIELFDDDAPLSVANFLYYLNNGLMVDTFFHRSVPGFIIQGGGFRVGVDDFDVIPPDNGAVLNEPCTLDVPAPPPAAAGTMICSQRGNDRGTVAFAKLGGDPKSATTNWFISVADNRTNLDNQNGGFTVFGRVLDMAPVDAIAAMQIATDDDTFWLETAIFPNGPFAPLQQPPLFGTPYGCFDPADQATVLDAAQLPALSAQPDPVISGAVFTVSAACGTPTTTATFTEDPGPAHCPDLDRIAVRTTGPAVPVTLVGGSPSYVELTCEQVEESFAQRALWQPDYVAHFHDQLVELEVVAVPEPATWVALPAGLLMLSVLRRSRSR
jgi:cyclophilin family peptidyl-prolyl cis-trans isomerase